MPQLTEKVYFDVWIHELSRWVSVDFKAYCFDMNGRIIKLFSSKVLCLAIGRKKDTVLRWERVGNLPQTLFTVDGADRGPHTQKRWYSEAQIRMVQEHMWNFLGKDPRASKNQHYLSKRAEFFDAVRRDWAKELDDAR